jgi:hypothetical protein
MSDLHPIQIERFRNMTPSEKHAVFMGLMRTGFELKRAALVRDFPDASEEEIDRKLARTILHGRP